VPAPKLTKRLTRDRVPKIDIYSEEGECPKQVDGFLEFLNINFIYPSRPGVQVLQNFNLLVPNGKITALVGASGSGKSTIVGLAERWYDPVEGQILLDGQDLKRLNLRWLRNQISLISQVHFQQYLLISGANAVQCDYLRECLSWSYW